MTRGGLRGARTRRLLVALTALAVGGGMAGALVVSPSKGATGEPVDPGYYATSAAVCDLLSASDLRAVLGRSYSDGEVPELTAAFIDIPGTTKCAYRSREKFSAYLETGVVYAYAQQIFQDTKRLRKGQPFETVDGVGDQAIWYQSSGELLVLHNEKIFEILVVADGLERSSERTERARRLAIAALERVR